LCVSPARPIRARGVGGRATGSHLPRPWSPPGELFGLGIGGRSERTLLREPWLFLVASGASNGASGVVDGIARQSWEELEQPQTGNHITPLILVATNRSNRHCFVVVDYRAAKEREGHGPTVCACRASRISRRGHLYHPSRLHEIPELASDDYWIDRNK